MTNPVTRRADAERFRTLHHGQGPLVLPNAWDAASAATLVTAGFGAIATSSGAISRSLGYSDGEGTPPAEAFAATARIVAGATAARGPGLAPVLVTADIETGYGLSADALVERLVRAGVVGCNLEDSDPRTGQLVPAEQQVERIGAVVRAARAANTGLVVNARVDVHVRQDGPEATRLERSMARARRYLAAGADCVFPIMLSEDADIGAYVKGVGGPVNVMARPSTPGLGRLAELGVARVTFGSGLHRASLAALAGAAETIRRGLAPWEG